MAKPPVLWGRQNPLATQTTRCKTRAVTNNTTFSNWIANSRELRMPTKAKRHSTSTDCSVYHGHHSGSWRRTAGILLTRFMRICIFEGTRLDPLSGSQNRCTSKAREDLENHQECGPFDQFTTTKSVTTLLDLVTDTALCPHSLQIESVRAHQWRK